MTCFGKCDGKKYLKQMVHNQCHIQLIMVLTGRAILYSLAYARDHMLLAFKDGKGCLKYGDVLVITEPSKLIIDTVIINRTTVTIFASGGTKPYMYRITGGVEPNVIDSLKTYMRFFNLGGPYTVYVTDNKNCIDTADQIEFPRLCLR